MAGVQTINEYLQRYADPISFQNGHMTPIPVPREKIDMNDCVDVRPVYRKGVEKIKIGIETQGWLTTSVVTLLRREDECFRIVDGRHRLIALQELQEPQSRTEFIAALVLRHDTPIYVQQTIAYSENESSTVVQLPTFLDRMLALRCARQHLYETIIAEKREKKNQEDEETEESEYDGSETDEEITWPSLEEQRKLYAVICPHFRSKETLGFYLRTLQALELVGEEVCRQLATSCYLCNTTSL
jgi:hypothetical protein